MDAICYTSKIVLGAKEDNFANVVVLISRTYTLTILSQLFSKDYRYKRDELFKRLKVTTFAQLVSAFLIMGEQDTYIIYDWRVESRIEFSFVFEIYNCIF